MYNGRDDFWNMFSQTGYIGNYLIYKQLREDAEEDETELLR